MARMISRFLIAAVATSLSAATAFADGVPKQLYNKSITLFWSETTLSKRLSDGQTSYNSPKIERIIYVSSAGRIFVKNHGSVGTAHLTNERGPEQSSGTTRFQGVTMTSFGLNQEVVHRATATFDPSFSSCQVSVTVAKLSKSAKITSVAGEPREMLSAKVESASCSVKDGNLLAGQ